MYADNYENRKEKGIMEILTPLEQAVYDYISRTIEKLGYAPSVRDIKAAVGIKSTDIISTRESAAAIKMQRRSVRRRVLSM